MAKIFCCPCADGPGAWTHAYDLLKELHAASTPRLHEWVETPEAADMIFLCNPQQEFGDVSATNPIRLKFTNKCFILSEQWAPLPRFAGIYANAPRKALWRSRFRGASYKLHHSDFKNPFIQNYDPVNAVSIGQPDLLFSFAGRDCHPVRTKLFQMVFRRKDVVVHDTTSYDAFSHTGDNKDASQREFFELCLRSKFIVCPRGVGTNSLRLFEAMHLGIAPIIVSDAWIPCEGPDWTRFAIFMKEKDIGRLEQIAAAHEPEFEERGREARRAHEAFFSPSAYFNYLVSAAHSIVHCRLLSERMILRLEPILDLYDRAVGKLGRAVEGKIDTTRFSRHPFLHPSNRALADS